MMSKQQKKMKEYTNSVKRRLNLPRDVKARVMTDFITSIAARREAGQTDEQIYAELGDPKKAAADLNEQMKEYVYRKSPWRWVFLALAVVAGGKLLLGWLPVGIMYLVMRIQTTMTVAESASVGIIGGADGPTAIFLTAPVWTNVLLWMLLMIAGVVGYLALRRCKRKA